MNKAYKSLKLTLKKEAFDVMVTGEKYPEYRKPSKWMMSRLFNKDGTKKEYDIVEFTNGYGIEKPWMAAPFEGFEISPCIKLIGFSNGLKVKVEKGDVMIKLGSYIESIID